MAIHTYPLPRFSNNKGHRQSVSGREELVIEVNASASASVYDAYVTILSSGGKIEIKGQHFHELLKALMRYSDRSFKQLMHDFLIITNDAAGDEPLKPLDLTEARANGMIDRELDNRQLEQVFNHKRKNELLSLGEA